MTPHITSSGLRAEVDDALAYLPVSHVTEYPKSQDVFGPSGVSKSLHLLVAGKVAISRITERYNEVLLEIVLPDELFGEWAFLDIPHLSECATRRERPCDGMGDFRR